MVSSVKDAQWLQWMERLLEASAPESSNVELPRSRFYCYLDDQPDHLTPEHALRNWTEPAWQDHKLFVNPDCWFTNGNELPAGMTGTAEWLEGFALPHPLVWVRDPGTGANLPFWLGSRFLAFLDGAQPGEPALPGLPSDIERVLVAAGVLMPEDWVGVRHLSWMDTTTRQTEAFQRKGYVPVPNLLHPFQVSALRRYYRHMIRNGRMTNGDTQTRLRYFVHNESIARFFQFQWTSMVSTLVGEPVKPSFCYVASYQEGARLIKHVDREQCEFSITLCLDYSPEPRQSTPWPLRIHTPSGNIAIFQALGDGLLYRGRELAHSRDELPKGRTSTSIFFHYVRDDFSGPLE